MPSVDTGTTPMPPKPRINRATLDPTVAALLESMDDSRDMVRAEIVEIRHTLGGFKKIGWAALGGFFVLQVVQIVIFAQLLGVDVRATAAATREIVSATTSTTVATDSAGAPVTTVVTTPTVAAPSAAPATVDDGGPIPLDTDGDN